MITSRNLEFVKLLVKLIKEFFTKKDEITANEFIIDKLKEENSDKKSEQVYESFLLLMKHAKFFEAMVSNFWNYYKLKHFNKEIIMVIMFIIIFELNRENESKVVEMFTQFKYQFCNHVLDYFTKEDNIVDVVQAACMVFENDYILKHILHPILDKSTLIVDVLEQARKCKDEKQQVKVKPLTRLHPPACANVVKTRKPSLNEFLEIPIFKGGEIPRTTFQGDLKVQEGLQKAHEANKVRATELLQYAREKAFKCATIPPKPSPSCELPCASQFKSKNPPPKRQVTIKRNAASLMREAATLVKDKESEIKKIEALTQTIFDPTTFEVLEEHMRKCKEQEHLQKIERKHLEGQLTHEEAIIAKQNLLKLNQKKMEEFKKERKEILDEIDSWRQNEQEKIKALVEKSQNIEKAAKEAEKRLYQDKRYQARMIENETKKLLKEAYEKQREELACKVSLIQELRALQQVRSLHVKEFDPTDSPNFGLLCEMSIAELQERLGLLKIELQQELERRRKTIAESRHKQQHLIESVKQFICQTRVTKPKPVPRLPVKLEQTPDLVALRERLLQAKQIRISAQYRSVR